MTDTDTSAGNLRLPDRPAALAALDRLLLESWRGFDQAREGQPPLSDDLRERLGRPLPSAGIDAVEIFDASCAGTGDADFDGDGDVDLPDYAEFQMCCDGPATGYGDSAFESAFDGTINPDDRAGFVDRMTDRTP